VGDGVSARFENVDEFAVEEGEGDVGNDDFLHVLVGFVVTVLVLLFGVLVARLVFRVLKLFLPNFSQKVLEVVLQILLHGVAD